MHRPLRSTLVLAFFVLLAGIASVVPSPWREGNLLDLRPRLSDRAAPAENLATSAILAEGPLDLSQTPTAPPGALPADPGEGSAADAATASAPAVDPARAALAARITEELARSASPPTPLVRPCLADDGSGRCTRRAMDRYFEQLVQNALGHADRPARFSQLGDSLVLGDGFTGELRRLLAPWFGDGGHGFVYAGHPERHVGSEGPALDLSDAWRVRSVVRASERDPLFGIAGVAFHPEGAPYFGARAEDTLPRRVGVLWYPRTDTATFGVRADGQRSTLNEVVAHGQSALTWIELPDGVRRLRVDGLHDRSIYFGFLLENPRGSVVDNMGLVSGNVDRLLRIGAEHWREQIRLRDPDVVSFLYGVNSVDDGLREAGARHRDEYIEVLARFRELVPERDCLVISVLTRGDWVDGSLRLHPGVPPLVEAQRAAAETAGCAFWNAFEAAGGVESVTAWYRARPQLLGSDLAHPTRAGYVELARRFHHALLAELAAYLHEHPVAPSPGSTDGEE